MHKLLAAIFVVGCASVPPSKLIEMVGVGNCWYQSADVVDVACNGVEPNGEPHCVQYKVRDGDWEARCQEALLERYKREHCTFRRMSPGVVAVACPGPR